MNVSIAEKNPKSTLHYFRKLTQLRKTYLDELVYGQYTLLDETNPNVYAYSRSSDKKEIVVILNFKAINSSHDVKIDLAKSKLLLNNYNVVKPNNVLLPYQALIYEVTK